MAALAVRSRLACPAPPRARTKALSPAASSDRYHALSCLKSSRASATSPSAMARYAAACEGRRGWDEEARHRDGRNSRRKAKAGNQKEKSRQGHARRGEHPDMTCAARLAPDRPRAYTAATVRTDTAFAFVFPLLLSLLNPPSYLLCLSSCLCHTLVHTSCSPPAPPCPRISRRSA